MRGVWLPCLTQGNLHCCAADGAAPGWNEQHRPPKSPFRRLIRMDLRNTVAGSRIIAYMLYAWVSKRQLGFWNDSCLVCLRFGVLRSWAGDPRLPQEGQQIRLGPVPLDGGGLRYRSWPERVARHVHPHWGPAAAGPPGLGQDVRVTRFLLLAGSIWRHDPLAECETASLAANGPASSGPGMAGGLPAGRAVPPAPGGEHLVSLPAVPAGDRSHSLGTAA